MRQFIFICFVLWIIFILYATLVNFTSSNVVFTIPYIDKIVHFILFAVYSILLIPLLLNKISYKNTLKLVLISSIILGFTIELVQSFFTLTRTGSFADLLADTIGSIFSIIIYHYFLKNSRLESKLSKNQ